MPRKKIKKEEDDVESASDVDSEEDEKPKVL